MRSRRSSSSSGLSMGSKSRCSSWICRSVSAASSLGSWAASSPLRAKSRCVVMWKRPRRSLPMSAAMRGADWEMRRRPMRLRTRSAG